MLLIIYSIFIKMTKYGLGSCLINDETHLKELNYASGHRLSRKNIHALVSYLVTVPLNSLLVFFFHTQDQQNKYKENYLAINL